MAAAVPADDASLLKAIDGSYLKWHDFRKDVLLPFGICLSDTSISDHLPHMVLSLLQARLTNLPTSSPRAEQWRGQVAAGQGFTANSTIFPPNILPVNSTPTKVQRCLSPKMSREGLPRRTRVTQDSIFELPHAKPLFASAFVHEAFTDAEHRALPSALVPAGTYIDFDGGKVLTGRLMPCPFLVFEYCPSSKDDDIESTINMCAVSGAQCVKGIRDTLQKTHAGQSTSDNSFAFSCVINDNIAVINSHIADDKGQYSMSALCRFELEKDDHFDTFQIWIQAIEEWAAVKLLPKLKLALSCNPYAGDTPPVSPMPSLTLSIDTLRGSMPALMRALRQTYPAIKWQTDEIIDTPIMSSMAACGTPWEGRRLQSLALGPASPTNGPLSLMARRRHNSGSVLPPLQTRGSATYAPARPSLLSPRYVASPDMDWDSQSPCRPVTLSPCTPAPDMPWTAQSPMLVLRKRVDVAMDEIQELRRQMEALQSELESKTQLLKQQANINLRDQIDAKGPEPSAPTASVEKKDVLQPETSTVNKRHFIYERNILVGIMLLVFTVFYVIWSKCEGFFTTSNDAVISGMEQIWNDVEEFSLPV